MNDEQSEWIAKEALRKIEVVAKEKKKKKI